jgi:predicted SAM-dependent methyltransferase
LNFIDLLKTPWRKFYWWNKTRINPLINRRLVAKYVSQKPILNLELGSPRRPELEDWVFSDINGNGDIKMDFTKPLLFPDNSVDRIYSSHIFEHFSYPNPMMGFLKECRRILKKGGEFSIAVPNARLFLDAYYSPDDFDQEKFCNWDVGLSYKTPIDFVNFIAYMGDEHRHLFDIDGLVSILNEAGFEATIQREFDASIDLEFRRHESIYATAKK